MEKKTIFIASPLFNPEQHGILDTIEELCTKYGYGFYSARHDSEPFVPKGEDKKNPEAWDGVFLNNQEGLMKCKLMIAVLQYKLPYGKTLGVATGLQPGFEHGVRMSDFTPVDMSDNGTVWEMGFFRGQGKLVVGFHPEKPITSLNVMLSHGCDGLISGWENLARFLEGPNTNDTDAELNRIMKSRPRGATIDGECYNMYHDFDWSACGRWGAQASERSVENV